MAQFFIRSQREEGKAPLYTKIRRNGMQMYVCTGIDVDIKEWNKAQRSLSAMQRYEQTEEGAKVHDLQMRVMKAIDALYAEGKINTKNDKAIIEEAMSNIVTGGSKEFSRLKRLQKQSQGSMSCNSMSTSLLVYPMVPSVTETTQNILPDPSKYGKRLEGIFMNTVVGM